MTRSLHTVAWRRGRRNLLGLPAMSVPCGFTSAGLPIGLQIVGAAFAESTVLRAAGTHERIIGTPDVLPPR